MTQPAVDQPAVDQIDQLLLDAVAEPPAQLLVDDSTKMKEKLIQVVAGGKKQTISW